MRKHVDMTGVTWGDLTVIANCGSDKKDSLWLCQCTCGNTVVRKRSSIYSSIQKNSHGHCGCKNSVMKRGKNDWSFDGSFAYCKLNDGYTTKIDLEDYEHVKDYHWFIGARGYVYAHITVNNKATTIKLHRLIMDCPEGMVVDHINHDKLDNRKCNLRVCTQAENIKNLYYDDLSKRKSTRPYYGVYIQSNKWCATIRNNGKDIWLGYFNSVEDAIKGRREAELKYWGHYANALKE